MVQGQDVAVVEEFVYLGALIHALTVSSPDRMYTYHSRNLTLTEVLDMAKTAHTGGCCQRSVLPSLAQRSGTHCQTSSTTHRYRLTVSVGSLKHSCLQTRSVHSALEIFLLMRYINLRLLTYYYLLTKPTVMKHAEVHYT